MAKKTVSRKSSVRQRGVKYGRGATRVYASAKGVSVGG